MAPLFDTLAIILKNAQKGPVSPAHQPVLFGVFFLSVKRGEIYKRRNPKCRISHKRESHRNPPSMDLQFFLVGFWPAPASSRSGDPPGPLTGLRGPDPGARGHHRPDGLPDPHGDLRLRLPRPPPPSPPNSTTPSPEMISKGGTPHPRPFAPRCSPRAGAPTNFHKPSGGLCSAPPPPHPPVPGLRAALRNPPIPSSSGIEIAHQKVSTRSYTSEIPEQYVYFFPSVFTGVAQTSCGVRSKWSP